MAGVQNNLALYFHKTIIAFIALFMLSGMDSGNQHPLSFEACAQLVIKDFLDIEYEKPANCPSEQIKKTVRALKLISTEIDELEGTGKLKEKFKKAVEDKISEANDESVSRDSIIFNVYEGTIKETIRNTKKEEQKYVDFYDVLYWAGYVSTLRDLFEKESPEEYTDTLFKSKLSDKTYEIMAEEKNDTALISLLKEEEKEHFAGFIEYAKKFDQSYFSMVLDYLVNKLFRLRP